MLYEPVPLELAKQITPYALRNYARALGWVHIAQGDPTIEVYHHPANKLRQLIIPLDEQFDDYAESVAEAVRKLAASENRPATEVLNHLLLPPADVLRFRESSNETENGTVTLDQASDLINGARRMLLSVAHSILHPQPYHPRLARSEAVQFVQSCRFGQTERGSFIMTLACPLNLVPALFDANRPFARRVTENMMRSLEVIARVAENSSPIDWAAETGLSANFCEALLMLRPSGDRSSLSVSASWSKAISKPPSLAGSSVQLRQECFEVAEYLAPVLRSTPEPRQDTFVGFVDVLRGQPESDGRPSGEVVFSIPLDATELVRAKADLDADDYHVAGEAHLATDPVYFRGFLIRAPRTNRIEKLSDFRRLSRRLWTTRVQRTGREPRNSVSPTHATYLPARRNHRATASGSQTGFSASRGVAEMQSARLGCGATQLGDAALGCKPKSGLRRCRLWKQLECSATGNP